MASFGRREIEVNLTGSLLPVSKAFGMLYQKLVAAGISLSEEEFDQVKAAQAIMLTQHKVASIHFDPTELDTRNRG